MITSELEYSAEETAETARVLELQMGTPEEYQVSQLVSVIRGQREEAELPEIQYGWFDLFCFECGDGDCFLGTIEEAAAHFLPKWAVLDLDRSQAICKTCSNAPDSNTWASQYQDERGLLG